MPLFYEIPTQFASDSNGSAAIVSQAIDGASAVGTVLDTGVAFSTTGAKLLSVRNNTTEKAFIDKDGGAFFNSAVTIGVNGAGSQVYTQQLIGPTSSPLYLAGQTTDSGSAVNITIDSQAYTTAGAKLISFRNATVEKAYISYSGVGVFADVLAAHLKPLTATSAFVTGAYTDVVSSIGVVLDNSVTLTQATAKLVSIQNNTVEKAYFDKDGKLSSPGLIGTPVAIANISATGTPSSSTFLRGDGTWISAGGGITAPYTLSGVGDTIPFTINAISGQTAKLQSWQVNSVELAYISAGGGGYFSGVTIGPGPSTIAAWNSGTTYGVGNLVSYNSFIYKGLQVGMLNITPSGVQSDTAYWQYLGPNLAIGYGALASNTTGYQNIAIGQLAGGSTTVQTDNTFIGFAAGKSVNGSINNTAVGSQALYNNTNGPSATAVGYKALYANVSGFGNTGIGANAGLTNTGTHNIFLGSGADSLNPADDDTIVIGRNTSGHGTGTITIGKLTTYTATYLYGTLYVNDVQLVTDADVVGTSTLSFDGPPGTNRVELAVTGQTGILAGDMPKVWIAYDSTSTHNAEEHLLLAQFMSVMAGNVIAGTGFTIYAEVPYLRVNGDIKVRWSY